MLNVPWEITVVEKGTLGQATRMAGIGAKKVKVVANSAGRKAAVKTTAGPASGPMPGTASRMASVKIRSPKRAGVPSWANRTPGDTGPLLSLKSNGFDTLSKPGKRDLVPSAPKTSPTLATGAKQKSKGLTVPPSLAVAGGLTAGAATGGVLGAEHAKNKKRVRKSLSSTLGKPLKKPGGALKPVQPPKPMTGAKPPTAAAGPKPVTAPTAPAGPPPTLRPPSMMPPKPAKPGAKPVAR